MRKTENIPGRPRSFDTDTVLDQVVHVFFEYGFSSTNFSQLEAATGLHRQSIRYAFGDKQQLFEASIKRYGDTKITEITAILRNADRAIFGIRGIFDMWIKDISRAPCRGCFLVATSSDRTFKDNTDLFAAISLTNHRIIRLLEERFKTARDAGDISSDLDNKDLARQMLTLGDGVMALCQLPEVRAVAPQTFDNFYSQLRR